MTNDWVRQGPGGFRGRRLVLFAALLFAGCASPRQVQRVVQGLVAEQRYADAAAAVQAAKEKDYGAKNAFLYYADLGMTEHLAGKYDESNQAFERAKQIATDLFTKSVSREAATFMISDNVRPYAGEDFERALIHVFSALNYLLMGQGSEALVEVRQADFLLTKLQTDFGHKNVYTEDAFIRYLSGMIYEDQRQTNDAFIAYRKALDAYERYRKDYGTPAPPALVQAALRTAQAMRFGDEVDEIRAKWGGEPPARPPADSGEIVVLHYAGLPPYKVDYFFEIGFFAGWPYVDAEEPRSGGDEQVAQARSVVRSILADEVVRMAFPKYVPVDYEIRGVDVALAVSTSAPHASALAEDIGAIAEKNLQDRIARIRAKTIARAVVKYALGRQIAAKVEEKQGAGAGWVTKKLFQLAASATELADKRCWQTLPDRIAVATVSAPAGKQDLELTFRSASGEAVEHRTIKDVEVKAGRKTFIVVRTAI